MASQATDRDQGDQTLVARIGSSTDRSEWLHRFVEGLDTDDIRILKHILESKTLQSDPLADKARLPDDVLSRIIMFLSPKDICRAQMVSRRWLAVFRHPEYLRPFFRRWFSLKDPPLLGEAALAADQGANTYAIAELKMDHIKRFQELRPCSDSIILREFERPRCTAHSDMLAFVWDDRTRISVMFLRKKNEAFTVRVPGHHKVENLLLGDELMVASTATRHFHVWNLQTRDRKTFSLAANHNVRSSVVRGKVVAILAMLKDGMSVTSFHFGTGATLQFCPEAVLEPKRRRMCPPGSPQDFEFITQTFELILTGLFVRADQEHVTLFGYYAPGRLPSHTYLSEHPENLDHFVGAVTYSLRGERVSAPTSHNTFTNYKPDKDGSRRTAVNHRPLDNPEQRRVIPYKVVQTDNDGTWAILSTPPYTAPLGYLAWAEFTDGQDDILSGGFQWHYEELFDIWKGIPIGGIAPFDQLGFPDEDVIFANEWFVVIDGYSGVYVCTFDRDVDLEWIERYTHDMY